MVQRLEKTNKCTQCGRTTWSTQEMCRDCQEAARRGREAARLDHQWAKGPIPGAPPLFESAYADHETILSWIEQKRQTLLVITGATGTGKTWQAWGVVRALRAVPVLALKSSRMSFLTREELAAVEAARVVILDDLGARSSAAAMATALEVVDARLEAGLVTVVTSNATLGEIAAAEPRLASRLASGCIVRLKCPDRRLPQRGS